MTFDEIQSYNSLVFERLSVVLNYRPDFVTKDMVDSLAAECDISEKEAFSLLFFAALGFDTENKHDRDIYENYVPFMFNLLDETVFENDLYYKTVRVEDKKTFGDWELFESVLPPFSAFVCDDPITFPDGRIIPRIGVFDKDYRFLSVSQKGREWMTLMPNEIVTQRLPIKKAKGKVLTYGLGLGYFAFMCAEKDEVASVTVVERDEEVVSLFKKFILPYFNNKEKIKIVLSDAFEYAEKVAPTENFDYIFADIWHDASDGVELYKKFKKLESLCPDSTFDYWVENTLKLYM